MRGHACPCRPLASDLRLTYAVGVESSAYKVSLMTTDLLPTKDLILGLFVKVDDQLNENGGNQKHTQANLYPSEVLTLALLFALKGGAGRAFYRWLKRDHMDLFPKLPDRTRLFRLFNTHRALTSCFLAAPSMIGVVDCYGIELLHPRREGRSEGQIGKKGISNQRWIVGGKLCFALNHLGLVVGWDCSTANVYDGSAFQPLVESLSESMVVFADTGFAKKDWHPANLRLCKRGEWNCRMVVETVLSMLTYVCHFKQMLHRVWSYFKSRLAYTMALFNLLVQWHGFVPNEEGFVKLSIAQFSL